jgi:hypothetical protein
LGQLEEVLGHSEIQARSKTTIGRVLLAESEAESPSTMEDRSPAISTEDTRVERDPPKGSVDQEISAFPAMEKVGNCEENSTPKTEDSRGVLSPQTLQKTR